MRFPHINISCTGFKNHPLGVDHHLNQKRFAVNKINYLLIMLNCYQYFELLVSFARVYLFL